MLKRKYFANKSSNNLKHQPNRIKNSSHRTLEKDHKLTSQHRHQRYIFQSSKFSTLSNQSSKKYMRNTIIPSVEYSLLNFTDNPINKMISEHRKQKLKENKKKLPKFSQYKQLAPQSSCNKQVEIPYQLISDIKNISNIIKELESLGFSQKTICQWMSRYLSKKNITITQIFMKIHINEKSLNNDVAYQRETKIHRNMEKLRCCIQDFPLHKSEFIPNQIRQFKNYLENILIKKTSSKLEEVSNFFAETALTSQGRLPTIPPTQLRQFIHDLKSIQERNGQLKLISKINRAKFQMLMNAEQKIVHKLHSPRLTT